MTQKYNDIYINDTVTIAGKYEKNGPLKKYYDKTYNDFYIKEKSFELGESNLLKESYDLLIKKTSIPDLVISGDLLNQLVASNYALRKINRPFLGIYNACATSLEGIIIASNFIENNSIKSCIVLVSSNHNAAEKQFRFPIEYGNVKPKYSTFTVTGSASIFLSKKKSEIKIESSTIGKVIDSKIKDVYNMGAVMAISCADTLYKHLKDLNRKVDYYDLILSGDLGKCGKNILKDYMKEKYNIILNNYDDSACMIYDLDKQNVDSGGSGPACLPLVTYSYILKEMKNKKFKKVLLLATGALMSPTMVNLKEDIPSICHAVSIERV